MKTCRECDKYRDCRIKGCDDDWCKAWHPVIILPDEWDFLDGIPESISQEVSAMSLERGALITAV